MNAQPETPAAAPEERIGSYRVHPEASLFPLLEGEEFDALVEDIRAYGQREKILVDEDGAILDGRNRYRACRELGIEPRTQTWRLRGDDSALALVISLNIKRRHLDATAKAVLAEKLESMFAKEAKERERIGGRAKGKEKIPDPGQARDKAAKVVGANPHYVSDVKALKQSAPEVYELVASGELTVPEAKAAVKAEAKAQIAEQIRNEPQPLPDGPFRVIVADPPWAYASRADDGTHRARNPYPDMSLDDIRALPVAARAADDAVLWLWTTNAFLRESFTVLDAWGFEYRNTLTWGKNRIGLGDSLRGQTEHCLYAIKGRPIVTLTNQSTLLIAEAGKHSAKPDEFYALVESLCPGSKLEMFARKPREGWQVWGAESNGCYAMA
ncbi:MAG: MT-A70 family methyltransferase [Bryobacteraceae bacterium]